MSYTLRIQSQIHEAFDLSGAQNAAREFATILNRSVIVLKDGEPFCTYHPTTCPHCEGHAKKVTAEFHDRE